MISKINRKSFILSFVLAITLVIVYDWYWTKVRRYPRGFDLESRSLWSTLRGKVDDLSEKDVVILGSSRGHFDINVHLWDSITGRKPLMLAYPGSSPFLTFEDIVDKSNFKGTLVVSVAPGLFFTVRKSWGANRGKQLLDNYYDRTYAQKFNDWIYDSWVDESLGYTTEFLSLKTLYELMPLGERDSVENPLEWPPMVNMDADRSIRMIPEMETDTMFQNMQKAIWFNPDPKNRSADSLEVIMNHYVSLVEKFKSRGGKVAFIRPPVTDYYLETETKLYPRDAYWDRLIDEANCPGYHFADHEQTKNMIPPEWSHLNRKDSDVYTRVIIELLKKDQLL